MADLSRRNVIGAAAAAGASWWRRRTRSPRASSRPSGRRPLRSAARSCRRSATRSARSRQDLRRRLGQGSDRRRNFPVSEKLAGVLMHARARRRCANCTGTPMPPNGPMSSTAAAASPPSTRRRIPKIVDFGAGDVWYFPRGHGHSIQGLGPDDCQFILVFDNGYFSEFGTFSITDWIGHVPAEVLAKNFGVPAATFARFPEEGGLYRQGPGAAAAAARSRARLAERRRRTHRYRLLAQRAEIFPGGTMRVVSEANSRSRRR